jgi:hypothetical protein
MFGKPNEGFHSTRFMGLALFDVVGTLLMGGGLALLIDKSKAFNINFPILLFICIIIMFLVGIVSHKIFCVDTALNKKIGELII